MHLPLLSSPLSFATAPPLPAPLKKTPKPSRAAFAHTARGDAAPNLVESHPYVHQIAEDLPADSPMEAEADFDVEDIRSNNDLQELWPVGEIDPKRGRFPCCIVWTPLPVVSWLAPYIGHVGICQEDGSVLDFAGSNLVSMDNFAYGSVARYLQLDRKKCCFPANLAAHVCEWPYKHAELGTTTSWDGALQLGSRHFQHKYYNLFTCNCYSFVANCLNRLAYGGSVEWNVLNVAALVWLHGEWVDKMSIVRSFAPFITVSCIGIFMAGWSFLIGISAFCSLLVGWFVFAVYCTKGLVC